MKNPESDWDDFDDESCEEFYGEEPPYEDDEGPVEWTGYELDDDTAWITAGGYYDDLI